MTITVIEFPTQYGMKRIEVSEQFLVNVKDFFTKNGIESIKDVNLMVVGYDRIKNLGPERIFEYGDEFYSGEVCCFGIVELEGKVDYILCENDQSEAILSVIFND